MSQLFSHSADVQMWLDCGVHGRVDLSRITPKCVVAKVARDVPPCIAELVVSVDGRHQRTRVNISRGFSNGRLATAIYPITDVAPF